MPSGGMVCLLRTMLAYKESLPITQHLTGWEVQPSKLVDCCSSLGLVWAAGRPSSIARVEGSLIAD